MQARLSARSSSTERIVVTIGRRIMAVSIHPSVDNGVKQDRRLRRRTLTCKCTDKRSRSRRRADGAHHVCGCTKCWKPKGALFSMWRSCRRQGQVSRTRQAGGRRPVGHHSAPCCKVCGVHMYGRIENTKHAFYGLDFVHTELSPRRAGRRRLRGVRSSIIESGADPANMARCAAASRNWTRAYDCLSPR